MKNNNNTNENPKQKKSKERIFAKIAKKIIKNGKFIILFWIILLLISLPLVGQVNRLIGLNENSSGGQSSSSAIATSIMNAEFGGNTNNGSVIVVFTGSNVFSNSTKNNILNITMALQNNSKEISYFYKMDNFYLTYAGIVANLTMTLQKNSNQLRYGLNMSTALFYALPSTFLSIWINDYHQNISMSSNASADAVNIFMNRTTNTTLKEGYKFFMDGFIQYWLYTFSNNSTRDLMPYARLNYTINESVPLFIKNILPVTEQSVAMSVFDNFNIANYSNKNSVDSFIGRYISETSGLPYWYTLSIARLEYNITFSESYNISMQIIKEKDPSDYPLSFPSILVKNFVSKDNNTMIMDIEFSVSSSYTVNGNEPLTNDVPTIRNIIGLNNKGKTVYVTGDPALNYDSSEVTNSTISILIPVTVVMIILVTALYFRSPITPLITLLGIGISIVMGYAVTFLVGTYYSSIDYTIPTILLAVLMGVGTDYSIFIVSRYREELTRTNDRVAAMETALSWAGESIAISGSTVIVSFGALAITQLTLLKEMGLIIGISVFIALMISLTLTPNLVLMSKNFAFWPIIGKRWKKYSKRENIRRTTRSGYFYNAGKTAVSKKNIILTIAIVVSIFATYIVLVMPTSYDMITTVPNNINSIEGMNAMSSGFGAGYILPTYVVITFNEKVIVGGQPNKNIYTILYMIDQHLSNISGVLHVSSPVAPNNIPLNFTALSTQSNINSSKSYIGKNDKTVLYTVVLNMSPDSHAAIAVVNGIRSYLNSISENVITGKYVGGETSSTIDTMNTLNSDFREMELIVIIGVFLILMIILSSLTLPIFAIISVGLTISWSLALAWLYFIYISSQSILWITPIILFILLMGLGMDYNIFILTRIREEITTGKDLVNAITIAIGETGSIITAAAVIMASAFAALFVSSSLLIKEFGFVIPLSVVLDAMVVRTYIMPSFMKYLDKWNWYFPFNKVKKG